jgi:hypothetical protein
MSNPPTPIDYAALDDSAARGRRRRVRLAIPLALTILTCWVAWHRAAWMNALTVRMQRRPDPVSRP